MYFLNSVVGVDPCRVGGDLVGLQLSSLIPWRLSVHCPPLLRAVMLMAVLATKRHGALHLLLGHIIAVTACAFPRCTAASRGRQRRPVYRCDHLRRFRATCQMSLSWAVVDCCTGIRLGPASAKWLMVQTTSFLTTALFR